MKRFLTIALAALALTIAAASGYGVPPNCNDDPALCSGVPQCPWYGCW